MTENGLRPSRYYITDDGYMILSSEVGAIDIDQTKVIKKDRLRPGKMLLVDTVEGKMVSDEELKAALCREKSIWRMAGLQPGRIR